MLLNEKEARDDAIKRFLIVNPILLFIAGILIICAVYWPGLNGPYLLDDGENILLNPAIALTDLKGDAIRAALMSNDSGPLKRPLASISFALNHYLNDGFYPSFAFKATNLGIHLLNTCLIYLFCINLLRTSRLATLLDNSGRQQVALLTCSLWALHPIQLTNILYVVQRMNSLAALFVLAGLIFFVQGRSLLDTTKRKGIFLMVGGTFGGIVLGSAAKENAILFPLLILTIEYVFFGFKTQDKQKQQHLKFFYILIVGLPILSLATYLAINPNIITDSYITRNFSLLERLLTETRVLWRYVGLLLFPISQHFGLFHDDIIVSTGIFTPISTFFAIVGLLIALTAALIQTRRHPMISFAILWFLAGHALESSAFGLELMYEHRNYLPSYGIFFGAAFGLTHTIKKRHPIFFIISITILLIFSTVTWIRANIWSDIFSLAEHSARTHPNSPRANDFAARTYLNVNHDTASAIRYTLAGLRLCPKEVGFYIDLKILFSHMAVEIENTIQHKRKQNINNQLNVHIANLDEKIQAIETTDGIQLSHHDLSSKKILSLLETEPITVHAIFSLENLRHCILDPPQSCARMRDLALTWFKLATDNPRTSQDYRAILANDTAMLYADTGDIARALEYIDRAIKLIPQHLSYRITRAEYLIRLGRLKEAGEAIDLIDAETSLQNIPEYKSNIRKLRDLYIKETKK